MVVLGFSYCYQRHEHAVARCQQLHHASAQLTDPRRSQPSTRLETVARCGRAELAQLWTHFDWPTGTLYFHDSLIDPHSSFVGDVYSALYQEKIIDNSSYNSAVFFVAADNDYNIYLIEANTTLYMDYYDMSGQELSRPASAEVANTYRMVASEDWYKMYDTSMVSYGDLILVMDDYASELNNQTLAGYTVEWPKQKVDWTANNSWPISINSTGAGEYLANVTATQSQSRNWIRSDWAVNNAPGDKTSPEEVPKFAHIRNAFVKSNLATPSRIHLSLTFMIIVIVCNALKLMTMIGVLLHKRDDYIVTLGDGAASFLERPDPTTERMCVMTKEEVIAELNDPYHEHLKRQNDHLANLVHDSSRTWNTQYSKYSTALNRDRQVGSSFM